MTLLLNTLKKIIICICLCIYVLFGIINTNGIGICYGSEHSKHIGINVFGYESCCDKEDASSQNIINTTKTNQPSYQSRCNCVDFQLTGDNRLQQISTNDTNNTNNTLSVISTINHQAPTLTVRFEEKYNKIKWNIYSRKKFDNNLAVLNFVMLVI